MADIGNVANLFASSPEIVNSPGLAADALSSGTDPGSAGQVLSYANTVTQIAQNPQYHPDPPAKKRGGLGQFFSDITPDFVKTAADGASTSGEWVLKQLARPLGEVQHDYRYLHAVIEKHGVAAGLLALMPTAAGAAIGSVTDIVDGPMGTILGAEAGTALADKLGVGYKDLYDATKVGANYHDKTGHLVSPGRDFADVIDAVTGGHIGHQGQGGYDTTSGIFDAVFDLSLDPLIAVGKVSSIGKLSGYGPKGADGARILSQGIGVGAKDLRFTDGVNAEGEAVKVMSRPTIQSAAEMPADRMVEVYKANPAAQSMVATLVETSTEQIYNNFPKLRPIAPELGKASTPDEVLNVFRDALTNRNYGVLSGGLPLTSITRRRLTAVDAADTAATVRTGVKNAVLAAGSKPSFDNAGNAIMYKAADGTMVQATVPNKVVRSLGVDRSFYMSSDLQTLTTKEFDPMDASSVSAMNQVLRQSQDARTANAITAQYANSDSAATRVGIYTNAVVDMLRSSGIKDESKLLTKWRGYIQERVDATGKHAEYGTNWDGKTLLLKDDEGESFNAALLLNQQGRLAMPSFTEIRQAQRESSDGKLLSQIANKAGDIDDFAYKWFTSKFFKPLALLSLGFAFRVSAGEMIPAMLKHGPADVTRGFLAATTQALNPGLGAQLLEENAGRLNNLRVTLDDTLGASKLRRRAQGTLSGAPASSTVGRIVSTDVEAKTAQVMFNGELSTHSLDDLHMYHNDVSDKNIRLTARAAGISFDENEVGHIKAAVGYALHGVSRALLDPEFERTAIRNIMGNGSHMVAPQLAAGGTETRIMQDGNTVNAVLKQLGKAKRDKNQRWGNSFQVYGGETDLHPMYWQKTIKEVGKDPGTRRGASAYMDSLAAGGTHDEAIEAFRAADKAYMTKNSQYANQLRGAGYSGSLDDFATTRSDAFRGQVFGPEDSGTDAYGRMFHKDVADAIAEGRVPSLQQLDDVPLAGRPKVKGRVEEDIPVEAALNRVIQAGYAKALEPIINHISREPIYTTLTTQHFKDLKPFIEAKYYTEGEANWIAQQRAATDMLPLIHNTELRSQMSELVRNFAPFYFAQEQAYRRYGKAILSDPASFARYQLGVHAITSSGIIQHDNTGSASIVFPGVGGLTEGLTAAAGVFGIGSTAGIPSEVSGNVSSLKSVLPGGLLGVPEAPGTSPLLALPLKAIEKFFPSSEPYLSGVIGPIAQQQGVFDALMPNALVRHVIQATPMGENSRSFQTAFAFTLINFKRRSDELRAKGDIAGANQLMPDATASEMERQIAVDRAKASTRVLFYARAVFGAVSPLAPKFDVGDHGLRQEVRDEVKKAGDLGTGIMAFLAKHPDATADTVFLSDSKYTGTSVPAGVEALNWVTENHGFVKDHPLASAYLIPQTTDFSAEAYNQELAIGLRQRKTPEQLVKALYAASANAAFYPALREKTDYVAAHPDEKSAANAYFKQFTQQLAAANPIWYAELTDPQKGVTAGAALKDLMATVDSKSVPDTAQSSGIRGLIADYKGFATIEQQNVATRQSNVALTRSWQDYLSGVAKANPMLAPVVNGVFRKLPAYDIYAIGGE